MYELKMPDIGQAVGKLEKERAVRNHNYIKQRIAYENHQTVFLTSALLHP